MEIPTIYNKSPAVNHVSKEFKMEFNQILNKPFLVNTISWSTTNFAFTELTRLPFPSSVMTNYLARVPFNSAAFYQAKMCCMLQVSGTPMHQGLLLVAAVPHGTPMINHPNQILSAPHVFLNACESTSSCLECPMYTPSTLRKTQDPSHSGHNFVIKDQEFGYDVFDLVVFVMQPLEAAVGASTSVSVSVHTIFKEAEFYVPKVGAMDWQAQCGLEKYFALRSQVKTNSKCVCGDKELSSIRDKTSQEHDNVFNGEGNDNDNDPWTLPTRILDRLATGLKSVTGDIIDAGRSYVRSLTGFHNPNIPTIENKMIPSFRNFPNNVDQPVHLEVMDNHSQFSRIYDDYYFRTDQDEMDLRFLCSKPVYVGQFKVSSTTHTGKNLFAYPITPMVENNIVENGVSTEYYSPLRTLYEASRFWRGGLKLHIQAVCTNFHYCKIIVVRNYSMTAGVIEVTTPIVPQYSNIHNMATDTLEFSAGGQIQTIDMSYNSPLRQLECTKDVVFNSVNHGMVYGYLVQPLTFNSNVPTTVTFNVYISGGEDLEFSGYSLDNTQIEGGTLPVYHGSFRTTENDISGLNDKFVHTNERVGLETMVDTANEFVSEGKEVSSINTIVKPNEQVDLLNEKEEIVEATKMSLRPNTSIRDYMRFMYPRGTYTFNPLVPKFCVAFDVNSLLNPFTLSDAFQSISSLYLGMSGGIKLKFKIVGANCASAMFVPPSFHVVSSSYPQVKSMSNSVNFTDALTYNSFHDSMGFVPSGKSFTGPQIEMQDYVRPYSASSPSQNARMGNCFELEMAIPNMNPHNFVGSPSKWYDIPGHLDYQQDLGVVYLNISLATDGTTVEPFQVIPFIGLNDESRLGFQVYCPKKVIPTYTSGAPAFKCRDSVLHPRAVPPVYPNGLPIQPLPVTGSSYYFNST